VNARWNELRFGVISSRGSVATWQAKAIRELLVSGNVRFALSIVVPEARDSSPSALYRLYERLLRCAALRKVDSRADVAGVPQLRCRVEQRDGAVRIASANVDEIRHYDLDFILDFSDAGISGGVVNAARLGVWRLLFSGRDGGPPGFWEIYDDDPITSVALVRSRAEGDELVLKQAAFPTRRHSPAKHVDRVLFESGKWPARVCRELLAGTDLCTTTSPTPRWLSRYPGNGEMLRFGLRLLRNVLVWGYRGLFRHDVWTVALADAPIHEFLRPAFAPTIRPLRSPSKRYLADPFAIRRGDRLSVLCEDFDIATFRGVIAEIDIGADGTQGEPRPVLKSPFHLSYPCTVEHEGRLYCIPEAIGSGEIALYELDSNGAGARKAATLVRAVPGADPTLFRHGDLWWLAYALDDHGSMMDLHLWYSTSLLGPYRPHRLNPVKQDVRSSRPAGTPFEHQGVLYRPAQDCSVGYGSRVVVCRVERLTPNEFHEEPVAVVGPFASRGLSEGVHTLASAGSVTLLDGRRSSFISSIFLRRLSRGMRGLPEAS
jgi:hypothetical protein